MTMEKLVTVKNPNLQIAVLNFSAELISQIISFNNIVVVPEKEWIKSDDYIYQRVQTKKFLWDFSILKAYENAKQANTLTYKTLVEELKKDTVISKQLESLVGTSASSTRLELKTLMLWHTKEVLRGKSSELSISSEETLNAYYKLEEFLYSEIIEITHLTPINSYSQESNVFQLSDNLSIIKMTEEQILRLLESGVLIYPNNFDRSLVQPVRYAVQQKFTEKKYLGSRCDDQAFLDLMGDQTQELNGIINSLRAFGKGEVTPISTFMYDSNIFNENFSHTFETPVKRFPQNTLDFNLEEESNFKQFWDSTNRVFLSDKPKFLSFAIRRFSQSITRDNYEDKIVDLMISAEAIFVGSEAGSRGALSYKVSHRAAMLLGNSPETRAEIMEFMKSAYSCRSSIVHGEGLKCKNIPPHEFIDTLEKHIRKALLLIVKRYNEEPDIKWKNYWNSITFQP
ncbi:hypothetical protein [Kangiella sp. M94]